MYITRGRTRLTDDTAACVFGEANSIDNDYALHALLRAIVINSGETNIEAVVEKSKMVSTSVSNDSQVKRIFAANEYAVTIVNASGVKIEEITADGWNALDGAPYPVNLYLSQIIKTRVFVSAELCRVIAFFDGRLSRRWTQAFMSTLPRVMTWYFTNPSEEDRLFFKSIALDGNDNAASEQALVNYVNAAAQKIDLRAANIQKRLGDYANVIREREIRNRKSSIQSVTRSINEHRTALAQYYKQLEDENVLLTALVNTPNKGSDSMINFFQQHKQIYLIDVRDEYIEFGVDDTLEFYDDCEFESLLENRYSYLYDCADDELRNALKAIFLDKIGVVRTNAVFRLESMRLVNPRRDATFVDDAMPHPHICFFGCSGGNEQYYTQYAESGDWELAVEQAIGAAKNLNWGDSTVCSDMIEWIQDHMDTPFIYINDKKDLVSMKKFMEFLKGEVKDG